MVSSVQLTSLSLCPSQYATHSQTSGARAGSHRRREPPFPSIQSVMEGSAQTEREPQESETDLEQPDHRTPPCRLESIHIRRFLNRPIIKMETSFAFSERVRSWLQSEDASERDPAASYAIFKRFIEYEEVEPITTWTPKLDSEATWLHRDPQYLGQAARKFERRVKSIKPEAFF